MGRKTASRVAAPSPGIPEVARLSSSLDRVLRIIALSSLLFLGIALGARSIASPDLGFHLATAQWMTQSGWVPETDPFTYTVSDHAYTDLQWLFQLSVYGTQQLGGAKLITALTTALTLLFTGLLLLRTSLRNGRLSGVAILMGGLFLLGNHWEPRPHLLSWLFGSMILLILEEHSRGRSRWLPFLPVVMALWVNSHSLFVLGIVILTVTLAFRVRTPKGLDKPLLKWSIAAGLACFLNPYHIEGVLFPLVQLRDIQGASGFKSPVSGIGEFTSPFSFASYLVDGRLVLFQPRLFWQLFTALALIGFLTEARKASWVERVLFVLFLYTFWKANKNFGYFAMVAFPVAAAGLQKAVDLLRHRAPLLGRSAIRAGILSIIPLLSLGFAGLAASGRLAALAWDPTSDDPSGFNAAMLPVAAAEFLREHSIEGRLLNTWNDGGYLAWKTGLPVTIYSHGEVMGPRFYELYTAAKQPGGFEGALERWQPTIAVVPFQDVPYWLAYLNHDRAWRLVFVKDASAVFLHESLDGVPALPKPEAGREFPAFDASTLHATIQAATEVSPPGLSDWLRGREAYPIEEMTMSGFYLQTGQPDACIGLCLEGLRRTDFMVPDLLLNLGHALNMTKRYELADVCFEAFLAHDDDAELAAGIRKVQSERP